MDIKETSVSGISSGAFFSVQMQVAFSSIIKGAGIVAGGPYDCGGQTTMAFCMFLSSPLVSLSVSRTNSWSGKSIDDKSNLAHQKVYMISGKEDVTVSSTVMDQLYKYYVTQGHFIPASNIAYKHDLEAGHTFPTDFDSEGNNKCTSSSSPFVSNCHFDGAGAILEHIYGNLKPRSNGSLSGHFLEFDQSEFIEYPLTKGLDKTGFAYVPKSCADGQKCRLHIAFHGCAQSFSDIGDKFVKHSGYDRWADTNNIIVLFPQTHMDIILHLTPTNLWLNNLAGCWDWIGWYGSDFATKDGVQLNTIKKMIDRIAGK